MLGAPYILFETHALYQLLVLPLATALCLHCKTKNMMLCSTPDAQTWPCSVALLNHNANQRRSAHKNSMSNDHVFQHCNSNIVQAAIAQWARFAESQLHNELLLSFVFLLNFAQHVLKYRILRPSHKHAVHNLVVFVDDLRFASLAFSRTILSSLVVPQAHLSNGIAVQQDDFIQNWCNDSNIKMKQTSLHLSLSHTHWTKVWW